MDQKTLVTFLLDRTGSMVDIKRSTIEAFNGYLDGLRGKSKDHADELIDFTFLQFDSVSLDTICVAEPVGKVVRLTEATYVPRASTPLIDACVKTILAVAKSLTARSDKPKVVVCFQTDGLENASTEHDWDELNRLIKEKTAEGWQFNFLGVGIDAYDHAKRMGIDPNATVAASLDSAKMTAAYEASASNARSFSRGLIANTHYSARQKAASGDRFHRQHSKRDLDLTTPATSATATPKARRRSLVEEPKL